MRPLWNHCFFAYLSVEVKKMLVAKWRNQFVYADEVAFQKVVVNRKELRCPTCQQPVFIKKGQFKSPHFAHRDKNQCLSFSEGETQEHIYLKKLLFRWSNEQLELEAYLPKLQQRPDLLSCQIVIEVQCSILAQTRMIERTSNYLSHGYQAWWLMGEKLMPKGTLTALQRSFCSYNKLLGCHFWCIDAREEKIHLYYHVLEFPKGELFFQKKEWAFKQETLAEIYACRFQKRPPICQTELFQYWGDYQKILFKELVRKKKQTFELQKKLYLKQKNLQAMSHWMYQPSAYYLFFGVQIMYYRSYFEELLNQRKKMNLKELNEFFQVWRKQTTMKKWTFPLCKKEELEKKLFLECLKLSKIEIIRNFEKLGTN